VLVTTALRQEETVIDQVPLLPAGSLEAARYEENVGPIGQTVRSETVILQPEQLTHSIKQDQLVSLAVNLTFVRFVVVAFMQCDTAYITFILSCQVIAKSIDFSLC
jgi:hypothetical protein